MFTRRRFLAFSAAGATAVAVPTVIVPKAKALVTGAPIVEEQPKGRLQRQLRLNHKREVEQLYDEEFATELEHRSMFVAHFWRPTSYSFCQGASISIEKEVWHDMGGRWQEKRCRALGLDLKRTT